MQWEFSSAIILLLNKLWKVKFFILCDVILLVRLQEKFELGHCWDCRALETWSTIWECPTSGSTAPPTRRWSLPWWRIRPTWKVRYHGNHICSVLQWQKTTTTTTTTVYSEVSGGGGCRGSKGQFKRGGTTLTYDCRMQLAHVIHTTRISSCKSTSQLPQDCRIQLEKSCRVLKRFQTLRQSHGSHDLRKLHATIVSQSCAV